MIQKPKHRQLLCRSSYYASTNKHSDLKEISISVSGQCRKWPRHSQIHLSVLMLKVCIVVPPRSISIFFWDSMTTWQLHNLIHPCEIYDIFMTSTPRFATSQGDGLVSQEFPFLWGSAEVIEANNSQKRRQPVGDPGNGHGRGRWARHRVDGTVSMAPVVQRWGDFPMDFPIPVRLRMMAI